MKEHQIAAIYNHENPEMFGISSMMGEFAMSSLVDNIVLLNFVELGDTFRIALTIGKMRSNPVNRASHEVEITDGKGMRVLPRKLPDAMPQSSFSRYHGLISRAPERRSPRPPEPRKPEE
jgi:KaiC/GvpD/RAD55 family RecA-like ATPase